MRYYNYGVVKMILNYEVANPRKNNEYRQTSKRTKKQEKAVTKKATTTRWLILRKTMHPANK